MYEKFMTVTALKDFVLCNWALNIDAFEWNDLYNSEFFISNGGKCIMLGVLYKAVTESVFLLHGRE
jgi:hypothetical protein